jgi:hypothetical protein
MASAALVLTEWGLVTMCKKRNPTTVAGRRQYPKNGRELSRSIFICQYSESSTNDKEEKKDSEFSQEPVPMGPIPRQHRFHQAIEKMQSK